MAYVSNALRPTNLHDRYTVLLGAVLAGYAMMGKGFAYLGLPPIYMGEIAFLAGIVVLLRTGCLIAALTTFPSLLLAVTMLWVLLRTVPFISDYGVDALRDSIVVEYAGFAFIVIALLLEDPGRINTILRCYRAFLCIYIPTIPFLYTFSAYFSDYIPQIPGTGVPLLSIGPGEVAVHVAGAAIFALVGFQNLTILWMAFLLASAVIVGAISRGPMLAEALPIAFAAIVLGKGRQLALTIMAGLAIFVFAYAVEPVFFDYVQPRGSLDRPISTRQIVDNVSSIAGRGSDQAEDTKEWRLKWWNKIIDNTVFGPNFWTGRGFGLNLAIADGFTTWNPLAPPLRSPHNAFMTILARAGVPGVTLWFGILASWFAMMLHALWTARRHSQTEWAGLFLFINCYVGSIIINASFDVALEAPMQGVWFWCMVGFGVGSVMVYRAQRHEPI